MAFETLRNTWAAPFLRPTRPPGPRGWPLIGTLFDAWRDPIGLFERGVETYGNTVRFRFGPYNYLLIHEREDLHRVLIGNHQNYPKSPMYDGLRSVLGEGLVTSEGEHWRRQRKLVQPSFHPKATAGFSETISGCTQDLLRDWDNEAQGGSFRLDLHQQMNRLTFRIIGRSLFSVDLGRRDNPLSESIEACLAYANERTESMALLPRWLPTPSKRRFDIHKKRLDQFVDDMVAERRKMRSAPQDLLGTLMGAQDAEGRMSASQLRDELLTLATAGHETTATALTWTLLALSRRPTLRAQVEAELNAELGDVPVTYEDLSRLPLLGQVLDESLRLHPPAWIFERQARQSDTLAGFEVAPGTVVGICTWTLHRRPEFWPNPETFDPARFTPENISARPRLTYLPFGSGPRICVGAAFAKMEAKLILADLLRRWRFSVDQGPVPVVAGITLRPKKGLPAVATRIAPRTRQDDSKV